MRRFAVLTVLLILTALVASPFSQSFPSVYGADQATIDALQKNIADRNAQVAELDKQIKALDAQIQDTSKQGQSLKSAIATLEASRAKLLKEIQATQNKIGTAALSIEKIKLEIKADEDKIAESKLALGDTIRNINQSENVSLVENLFAYDNVAELWNDIEALNRFQVGLRENMAQVATVKDQLSQKQAENEAEKNNLVGFQGQLQDQKDIVDSNKNEKAKLLNETQNKEANYRKQLEEKKQLSEAFQKEITDFESQLKFVIDPNSFPKSGTSVLSWPLSDVFITQYFGDTAFAKSTNAYSGKGHNGVDFRASIGTPVMAALSGTVEGTGDTDLIKGCYSYGRWVLIRHDNGLSTLYGHLSLIKVKAGDRLTTGQVFAYSGNTGFTTGPHLHFGLYVSQAVKIITYTNSVHCKNAIIPAASLNGYLNPMLYLPQYAGQ